MNNGNNLWISKKENTSKKVLPKEFYEKLNTLIRESDINHLYLENIDDDTIDLSQIDTSKITENTLNFTDFEGSLDCSTLTGTMKIDFINTNGESAAKILSTCKDKQMSINWEETEKYELKSFLKGITKKNISLHECYIRERNLERSITQEVFTLISKVNAEYVRIDADGFKNPINLDLELNPKIESICITAYEYQKSWEPDEYHNAELGNIKIKSENKELFCSFHQTDITKNTRFFLPDSINLYLLDLNVTDIRAFKDLKNCRRLLFNEISEVGIYAGDMVYDAKEMPSSIMGELPYNDYNEFLKDLDSFFKLKQLKERMNLVEKYSYRIKKGIGAYATLENADVPVYQSLEDLNNKQNPLSSYFGSDELRCISSICLANEEQEVNVNSMEICEKYLDEGYEIIGVTFINIYATSKEDREVYISIENVQLALLPFK